MLGGLNPYALIGGAVGVIALLAGAAFWGYTKGQAAGVASMSSQLRETQDTLTIVSQVTQRQAEAIKNMEAEGAVRTQSALKLALAHKHRADKLQGQINKFIGGDELDCDEATQDAVNFINTTIQ